MIGFVRKLNPSGFKYKFILPLVIMVSSIVPLNTFAVANYDQDFYSNNDILFYNPTDIGCSETGGTVTQLSGADNKEKIWNYLTASGLSPEQTAGILGNIQSESGGTFSPTIQEFGKDFGTSGYGIVQWTGGRRTNVVAALTKEHPDLMAKYYNATYSTGGKSYTGKDQGYVSKNADTGELMPVADNDALLLTELNFMYQESTNRIISDKGIAHSVGTTPGDTEWEAIKKQTTVDDASNIWVYSFEVPANVDTTALARITNGHAIFDTYSTAASGAACASSVNGDKKSIATTIINNPNITFEAQAGQDIIRGIADGSNNGNDFPCGMNINILKIIEAVGAVHKIRVNSSNRACYGSSAGFTQDPHFNGNGSAVDFGPIDGNASYQQNGANMIIGLAAPYIVNNSGIGQKQCNLNLTTLPDKITVRRFSDPCTHLHIDVPPNVDQSLRCRQSLGCDESQKT